MAEETMLERTVRVVEELREVLVDGRALLKDLRAERKACEQLATELSTAAVAAADSHLETEVNDLIRAELDKLFRELGEQQRQAETRIIRSMEGFANLAMYGNSQGRGDNVLVAAARRARTNGASRG